MNSREQFEKFCISEGYPTRKYISPQGTLNTYYDSKTYAAYKAWQACESANTVEKDLFKIRLHDRSVQISVLKEAQATLIKMIQLLVRDGIIDADLEQQAESLVAKFAGKSEN